MAAQKGRDLLLKIHDGVSYQLIGGFRSNNFSINGESIDITNKGSVDGSGNGYREMMQGGGIVSISTSGSGVFIDDAAFLLVHQKMLNQEHADCEITVPDFMAYTGNFAINSLEMSGEHNGEVTYSISLESAGAITATAI